MPNLSVVGIVFNEVHASTGGAEETGNNTEWNQCLEWNRLFKVHSESLRLACILLVVVVNTLP